MHKGIALFVARGLLLVLLFLSPAYGFDCSGYVGTAIAVSKVDQDIIDKAITSIKGKKLDHLFSVSHGQLLLVRRFVSGEADSRGGNLWLRLRPQQIDKEMGIHVGNQILLNFSETEVFNSVSTTSGVVVGRKTCDRMNSCDVLPFGDALENLLYGLLRCNTSGTAVFILADGVLVANNMRLITDFPIGEGLYFSRDSRGLRLSSLIIMQ